MKFYTLSLLLSAVAADGNRNLKFVNPDAPCRRTNGKPKVDLVKSPLKHVENLPE
jgi:hypothetical protein